ncbi:LysR family transcriptional regulator [Frateuria aurantia]
MLDRLSSMLAFVRTVESGSFVAAARLLELSPQMVAKHVTALEQHHGLRLLNRTTRRQSLTDFGRLYFARCQSILAEVESADVLAQAARETPRGSLRINAPVTFGRCSLMPVVARFLEQFEGVALDLVLSDKRVDPVEEAFDAIIRIGPLDDDLALVARPLRPYRLLAVAAPDYLERHGRPRTPADLADHPCIGFTPWPVGLRQQWRFIRDGVEQVVSVRSRLKLNDWGAMHAAALGGYGVVLGYEYAVMADLTAGRLQQVLPDYAPPSRPMHLLYAADRYVTPKLRRFVEAIDQAFGAADI